MLREIEQLILKYAIWTCPDGGSEFMQEHILNDLHKLKEDAQPVTNKANPPLCPGCSEKPMRPCLDCERMMDNSNF